LSGLREILLKIAAQC